jgi:hypothetical protein
MKRYTNIDLLNTTGKKWADEGEIRIPEKSFNLITQ